MGISTLQSYRGAQVFEAIGLNKSLVDQYFTGTASRIEGVGLDVLAREALMKHAHAFRPVTESETELDVGGDYQYRVKGEYHLLNPLTVSKLQHAVRENKFETFRGIHRADRSAEPAAVHAARLDGVASTRDQAAAARRSGTGQRNRQALRHGRDVVRLHQQGSA